jgi:transcriptional regulator with XRE-family HTH domain
VSTITKHRRALSLGLGAAIRERRRAKGLTQTQLGHPLTRGFVSSIEHGRCLPSLAALSLMAERLDMSAAELLDSVKQDLPTL